MNYNQEDRLNYHLFLLIVQQKTDDAIDFIKNNGMDLDSILNGFNWTPLHTAAYYGNEELIQYLLDEGANLNQRTKKGMTAKDLAQERGHVNLREILNPNQLDGIINYNIRIGQKVS